MRRARLAAATVLAAALVTGTALTAAVSLSGGFERAADRADLPDLIVRFDEEARGDVDRRIRALPNVADRAYRTEITRVPMAAGRGSTRRGALQIVDRGRRGYEIVAGRDVGTGDDEVVLEAGVAREWGVAVGDDLFLGGRRPRTVVGISRSPDNVAFPLAAAPRAYISLASVPRRFRGVIGTNVALAWLRDPARQDVTLTQARAVSFGLRDVRFVTRAGVQVLVGQAAGIVIALLVAFSVVALGTAGVMLGASARSEVARRLPSLGVERAVGFSRTRIVAAQARRAALVAAPAAALGLAAGALVMRGPSERLLDALNEVGPGPGLLAWLAGAWMVIVALVAAASAWPAWRATRAPVAALLRGGELAAGAPPPRRLWHGGAAGAAGGFTALGARLATARRGRWATTVTVLAAAGATLVLLLSLASLLTGLRDDPGTVGKRYALTANLGEEAVPDVRALDGVADAAPRWAVEGSAAYALGQPLRLVAFPARAGDFETPPLAEGRRRRATGEAEVGTGLADALGLRPGSTLAVALPTGGEARFRVSGLVRSLENEGRAAYVASEALAATGALGAPVVAVALERGADREAIRRGLAALGARPSDAAAATTRNRAFLGILATVLRVVALTVALVCLAVLTQALVLTARERRPTIALLRTTGAGRPVLARLLAGACLVVLAPAAVAAIAVEWIVLGPAVSSLAAGYAGLSLAPRAGHVVLALGGLAVLGTAAVAWVTARIAREPVVAGLREEA
jgi:predicted lysophospholipase L1 biosynthesis ABC-type transport system permease subunit